MSTVYGVQSAAYADHACVVYVDAAAAARCAALRVMLLAIRSVRSNSLIRLKVPVVGNQHTLALPHRLRRMTWRRYSDQII